MADLQLAAVVVAAVAAFVLSGAYYAIVGDQLAAASAADPSSATTPAVLAVEAVRNAVVAVVVGWLVVRTGADEWLDGLGLGLVLWIGFPVVLWVGAVVHEGTSIRLAAIHGGDWLLKLLAVAAITAAWQ